jgi:putative spermidine/putrescine transport system ATP-binding protein
VVEGGDLASAVEARAAPPRAALRVTRLGKRYGDFVALAPTDLEVAAGEFLTLLGPSGSGKTTLLGLVAGLAQPDEGQVAIGDADVTFTPPYERDVGMVFQNYALFPHMTVEENVGFPLRMRRIGGTEARRRVLEALEMVRLPNVARRYPRELSGGQQQRIALARCMVYRPSIILMDEPLGALDKKLREQMQLEIKRIHRELGATIVYVTHDQEEAMTMSDRICLMNAGRIEQIGAPSDLYFRPHSLFVADFLGESNLLPGEVRAMEGERVEVVLGGRGAIVEAMGNGTAFMAGQRVKVMVRPQNLAIGDARESAGANVLTARVSDVIVSGSLTKLHMAPEAAGMPAIVAAYPTRAGAARHLVGDLLTFGWTAADAVAIADPPPG